MQKKISHIIISPHLDDAVLSCAGLLTLNQNRCLVVNIFTSHGDTNGSRYAQKYIAYCGYKSPMDYYKRRRYEETTVSEFLKYKSIDLGFPEAFFRYHRFLFIKRFFYTNKKSLFEKVHPLDQSISKTIYSTLELVINKHSAYKPTIYFPQAIGNHLDHVIVKSIAEKLIKNNNIKFYDDFPYSIWSPSVSNNHAMVKLELKPRVLKKKLQAILMYQSQIKPLFGSLSKFHKLWYKYLQIRNEIYTDWTN